MISKLYFKDILQKYFFINMWYISHNVRVYLLFYMLHLYF